ncbi:MAG: asparagine synthase (glutamine-hydrolyzing), partial [Deltaproteobacteria bacterium]|nr:asparagine synthase (glutamine-hydrolyzing) [Deltaproteobacteria bacterium]
MCGIAGIRSLSGRPVGTDEVLTMADVITHRGPDDFGSYVGSGVGLSMRRLQIIDLETGEQPIHNEDETVWVVLNGEIYNFREKRKELEARGHRFYTATDTEVIVHLYEEFGAECVHHLRGMFGFALWDARRRALMLARDRIGIKPLYYGVFGERLVFASEVKCFLTLPEVERRLDWTAVQHLFTFLVTPPAQSILEGVRKLEPGHVLVADQGKEPLVRRYWDLRFEPEVERSESALIEELRAVLRETVDLHMMSDVPLGAFLSGGLDSSAVVATIAALTDRPVKTLAIGLDDADFNELEYARVVSNQLGTEHHELVLEPNVFDILEDLPWYLDEPFGDSSAIPTYMVSKLAAEEVTVVLSGDGGDEVFAGYDKYVVEGRERRWDALPRAGKAVAGLASRLIPEGRPGRRFLRHHSLSGAERYL